MDDRLIEEICQVAEAARGDGHARVSAWMQRHLALDLREAKRSTGRRRGIHVRLPAAGGAPGVLDEARVRELADVRQSPTSDNRSKDVGGQDRVR